MVWIRIHTDEGVVGLGETYFGAKAVEAYIHESCAPVLLGRDPSEIERINRDLTPYVGFSGTGVESAAAQRSTSRFGTSRVKLPDSLSISVSVGKPRPHQNLQHLCRVPIRAQQTDWGTDDWGLSSSSGPYEDLDAFLNRADELALSLLEEGITGMKIWPFDFAAEKSDGYYISNEDLDAALEPFRKIRSAVGSKMDIMVSFTRCGDSLRLSRSPRPSKSSTRFGTRTRFVSIASRRSRTSLTNSCARMCQ